LPDSKGVVPLVQVAALGVSPPKKVHVIEKPAFVLMYPFVSGTILATENFGNRHSYREFLCSKSSDKLYKHITCCATFYLYCIRKMIE
jgi:hypothetical protein